MRQHTTTSRPAPSRSTDPSGLSAALRGVSSAARCSESRAQPSVQGDSASVELCVSLVALQLQLRVLMLLLLLPPLLLLQFARPRQSVCFHSVRSHQIVLSRHSHRTPRRQPTTAHDTATATANSATVRIHCATRSRLLLSPQPAVSPPLPALSASLGRPHAASAQRSHCRGAHTEPCSLTERCDAAHRCSSQAEQRSEAERAGQQLIGRSGGRQAQQFAAQKRATQEGESEQRPVEGGLRHCAVERVAAVHGVGRTHCAAQQSGSSGSRPQQAAAVDVDCGRMRGRRSGGEGRRRAQTAVVSMRRVQRQCGRVRLRPQREHARPLSGDAPYRNLPLRKYASRLPRRVSSARRASLDQPLHDSLAIDWQKAESEASICGQRLQQRCQQRQHRSSQQPLPANRKIRIELGSSLHLYRKWTVV